MTLKDYYQQIDSTKKDSYYFQERKIKRDIVLSFKYFFKKIPDTSNAKKNSTSYF